MDQMKSMGKSGLIRVKGEEVDVDLRVIPGFWSAEMEAEVTLTASIIVEGPHGRLLGGTVSGEGENRQDAGGACGGGADAMSKAAADALRKLNRALGERLANAPKLREAAVTPPP